MIFGISDINILQQGWKLQAVRLSGTGKNRTGQVKILDTFPKERLKFWKLPSVCLSRTGKNRAGQVDFPKERLKYFVISTLVQGAPPPTTHWTPKAASKFLIEGALAA